VACHTSHLFRIGIPIAIAVSAMTSFGALGAERSLKTEEGIRAAATVAAAHSVPLTQSICPLIQKQAVANRLSSAFFVRLIWKESRFNPQALSPKGAQGIAQFMPGTAADRGLADPFDPYSAIVHSASLLADLRDEFGNVGLAAAAYNAGAQRVRNWLSGASKTLPWETQDYVLFITGRPVDDWKLASTELPDELKAQNASIEDSCLTLKPIVVRAVSETKPPQAVRRPWGVQLAAGFSRSAALARFNRLKGQYGSVLGGEQPFVSSKRNLSRGRRQLYTVQVGANSSQAASALCSKIRARGGACIVRKN
jgi:hypothetical protein